MGLYVNRTQVSSLIKIDLTFLFFSRVRWCPKYSSACLENDLWWMYYANNKEPRRGVYLVGRNCFIHVWAVWHALSNAVSDEAGFIWLLLVKNFIFSWPPSVLIGINKTVTKSNSRTEWDSRKTPTLHSFWQWLVWSVYYNWKKASLTFCWTGGVRS